MLLTRRSVRLCEARKPPSSFRFQVVFCQPSPRAQPVRVACRKYVLWSWGFCTTNGNYYLGVEETESSSARAGGASSLQALQEGETRRYQWEGRQAIKGTTSSIGEPDGGDPAKLTKGYLPVFAKLCTGTTRNFGVVGVVSCFHWGVLGCGNRRGRASTTCCCEFDWVWRGLQASIFAPMGTGLRQGVCAGCLTDTLLEELPMKYCARRCGRKTGLERMVEYPITPSSQNTAGLRDGLVTLLAEAPSTWVDVGNSVWQPSQNYVWSSAAVGERVLVFETIWFVMYCDHNISC